MENTVELDLQRFYNINRRVVMWILFFAGLYLLRDFFAQRRHANDTGQVR